MKMTNKKLLTVGLIVGIIAVFIYKTIGSNGSGPVQKEVVSGEAQLVDPVVFSELVEKGNGFLVDVHIPVQTHIPGTDALIPYNEIKENTDRLPKDKNTPILVYCRLGGMSKQAAKEIVELGYANVYELDGGINAYKEVNDEVVISPGNQDLGTVIYGEVPTTIFTLTNFTSIPLTITRVSTSCGCTSAEVEEKELEAYGSTIVNVSFDPAVHDSENDLGDIVRTIFIQTNNPDFKRVTAEITAHVVKD